MTTTQIKPKNDTPSTQLPEGWSITARGPFPWATVCGPGVEDHLVNEEELPAAIRPLLREDRESPRRKK